MVDLLALADEHTVLAEKLGVEVEGRFEAVFVEDLDKADILRYRIVIAEGYRFLFSVPH